MPFTSQLMKVASKVHVSLYQFSGGRIGPRLGKLPILLLTTTGRKSGKSRTMPLLYLREGTDLVVVASKGGSVTHPDWFRNLQTNRQVEVQVGRSSQPMIALEADKGRHDRLWPEAVKVWPGYSKYQASTARLIPLVILSPENPGA